MDLAIVGLPLCGKSTVFRALTAGHGSAAGERRAEHLGIVEVPDERLDKLAALVKAEKVTPVEMRLHDLPPAFGRGGAPSGPAGESLAKADGLVQVVRAFQRGDVPHPQGSIDPYRDIEALQVELLLNDLGIVERRLEKLAIAVRSARAGEREAGEREMTLLERCHQQLESGLPLRKEVAGTEDVKALANYGLLSLKPVLLLINLDESEAGEAGKAAAGYKSRYGAPRTGIAAMCARLEAELAELPPQEAAEFRRELGAGEKAVERVLTEVRELLGLLTFFTITGEKEARAWAVPAGTPALQAAGRVHTDMERGFIRAEVIAWDKLLEFGSQAEARKHGQLRTEGKQYLVQDGDVINVLFHV